jgi:hypothetical protein
MENRIDRKNDESLYQPKIHSERIRTLYRLKQETGKPITVLLDQAISELAERHGTIYSLEEEPSFEKMQEETWEEYREYRELLDQLELLRCREELEKIKGNVVSEITTNPLGNDNRNGR